MYEVLHISTSYVWGLPFEDNLILGRIKANVSIAILHAHRETLSANAMPLSSVSVGVSFHRFDFLHSCRCNYSPVNFRTYCVSGVIKSYVILMIQIILIANNNKRHKQKRFSWYYITLLCCNLIPFKQCFIIITLWLQNFVILRVVLVHIFISLRVICVQN